MSDVDDFVKGFEHPLKKVLQSLRRAILEADERIEEGIKWNVPSFRTSEWFATTHVRKADSIGLILHLGAKKSERAVKVDDPAKLLTWLGADRAMTAFGSVKEVNAKKADLQTLVREWCSRMGQ